MTIVDIWGGMNSQDHVARYILSIEEALNLSGQELASGYLVNLRNEIAWGEYQNFDIRMSNDESYQ